ncbi:MAG: glycosyltransferase family 2 protein [Actinomycetia bacterium]|nr:glycosyltransferase family 2 protein [Actinomycetes bacterium]
MVNNVHPLVTIAIPTYNRAGSYLREALAGAMNQTYENIEIIVSDNCSSDNTEAFIKGISDRRIRYFRHKKNIGANNNFNYCLEQAKGDYFLLLQDDDMIDNDFVEACMTVANHSKDTGIIRTGTRIIDSEGKVVRERTNDVVGLSTEEFFLGWFAGKTVLYLCSTLSHTKRLREIGGFKSKHNLFQDVMAEVQLVARYGRIDTKDIKASFRRHHGEMTFAVKVKDWCEDSLELLDLMCNLASENKALIRSEGMRFFSKLNYGRASAVKSPVGRFIAYMTVLTRFNYKSFPLFIRGILYNNPLCCGLRYIKREK